MRTLGWEEVFQGWGKTLVIRSSNTSRRKPRIGLHLWAEQQCVQHVLSTLHLFVLWEDLRVHDRLSHIRLHPRAVLCSTTADPQRDLHRSSAGRIMVSLHLLIALNISKTSRKPRNAGVAQSQAYASSKPGWTAVHMRPNQV